MTDPRLTKSADTLVGYSLDLQPKEQVLIRVDEAALPLAKEVYRAARSRPGPRSRKRWRRRQPTGARTAVRSSGGAGVATVPA